VICKLILAPEDNPLKHKTKLIYGTKKKNIFPFADALPKEKQLRNKTSCAPVQLTTK